LQEPELYNHQEPEEAYGSVGNAEILQYVPEAHRS
jgi:hypothetical protein